MACAAVSPTIFSSTECGYHYLSLFPFEDYIYKTGKIKRQYANREINVGTREPDGRRKNVMEQEVCLRCPFSE